MSAKASTVFRPCPVMQATTRSSRRTTPPEAQFPERGDRDAAGGLGEDPLGPGEQPDPFDDLGVGHGGDRAGR